MSDLPSQLLLERHQQGDPDAATEICSRYLARLVALAEARISPVLQSRLEGADAVQSALRSFFFRAEQGQFHVERSGELWRLLATLTIRKVLKHVEREDAARRSPRRSSAGEGSLDLASLAQREPTPDDVVALNEVAATFLSRLPEEMREVVALRMEDLSTSEIARRVGRSERTIRRWLEHAQAQLAALLAGS